MAVDDVTLFVGEDRRNVFFCDGAADINRAEEAFKRAEERLTSKKENVDIERAKRALARANARLQFK